MLRDAGLGYRIVRTDCAGHATQAARDALLGGERYLVAVGGDGTVHEVVNGMFAGGRPLAADAVLAGHPVFRRRARRAGHDGPKSDSFTTLPKVYRGAHLPHRNTAELRAGRVRVDAGRPFPVEADGETPGTTPASFGIIPNVIRLKV